MFRLNALGQLARTLTAASPALEPSAAAALAPLLSGVFRNQADFSTAQFDEALDDELFGEEREAPAPRQHGIPDGPRTLDDYNRLLSLLAQNKRSFLMRDVFDEMSLNGVRPNRRSYYTGLFSSMKSRKLGDAMFFWEEMQRHGFVPDAAAYTAIISACGRCGHLMRAVEFKQEMLSRGLEMRKGTYLALLSAFAEAGKLRSARDMLAEMEAAGIPADEYAYAALMSCYMHMSPRSVPADSEQQLLGLLEHARAHAGPAGLGLVIYNALLQSLAALRCHERVVEVFRRMREEEGLQPDSATYSNVIRSHLVQALGNHRQPQGRELTNMIEARMQHVDLEPFIAAVRAERETRQAARSAAEAAAGDSEMNEEVELEELSEEPCFAAQQALPEEAGSSEEGEQLLTAAEGGPAAAQGQQPSQQAAAAAAGAGAGQAGAGSGRVRQDNVLAVARQRARSRVRFNIMAESVDVQAWYQALHLFQEVLDAGLVWGPEIGNELVKASLDLAAAGVEDTLEVAHSLLERFEQRRLFIDVETGTDLLLLSVRWDVGDLSVAHRVWDQMYKHGRFPRTPVLFKYMRAICQREPTKSPERLRQICTTILNDPDRSAAIMQMKREAYRRREVFGGGHPVQGQGSGGRSH